ncbi:MAG TPA: acetamidase/formamidase family protein, partial [Anaerolineales bacterium]
MATYRLDDLQPHAFWDNSYPARIRVKSGDTVVFETLEASANQVTPTSKDEAVANLDFGLIHPLTGPVYV